MDNHKKSVLWMIDIAKLLAVVCGATLLGILFVKSGFPETNIVVIYIFAVLLVARFTKGYLYGILSSVVCLLCFNYFFTAPYHTLAVNDPSYMITFCIMLITALITSALTTKEKLTTMEATRKGMESQTLYMLSSKLSDAADIEAAIKIAAESRQNQSIFSSLKKSSSIEVLQTLMKSVENLQIYEQNIWRMRKTGHFRSTDRTDFWQLS